MKKMTVLLTVAVFAIGLLASSCNSQKRLCPAYPPSTYHGDANDIIKDLPADDAFIVNENDI